MPRRRRGQKPSKALTPIAIAERNPVTSPLLRLPGELRNRIYDIVIADLQKWVLPRYPVSLWSQEVKRTDFEAAHSFGNVCQQVRAEFMSKFRDSRINVPLDDMNHFIHMFCAYHPQPKNLEVSVTYEDVWYGWSRDMKLFFLTKRNRPDESIFKYVIDPNMRGINNRMSRIPLQHNELRRCLSKAECLPHGFMRHIRRGYIAIELRHEASSLVPRWQFKVTNKTGTMDDSDKKILGRFCSALYPRQSDKWLAFYIIFQKHDGSAGEMWTWSQRRKFYRCVDVWAAEGAAGW